MGNSLQPGVNLFPFVGSQHPAGGAGGNRGGLGRRPGRNEFRSRLDVQIPSHGAINIILVVGAVQPWEQGVHESAIVRGIGRIPEFLDQNRTIGEGRINIRLPAGGGIRTLVVVDMRRINDSVATGAFSDRAHSREVIGVLLAADDADVLGVGSAGQGTAGAGRGAPDRVEQGLEPRRGVGVPSLRRSAPVVARGHGSAVKPDGPGIGERLVEQVEQHGRIVGVARRHTLPKNSAVAVGHGVLLGGRARRPVAGPLKVKVAIDVVVFTKGHNGIDQGLVVGLAGGATVGGRGLRVAVPPILVERNAYTIHVPIGDGFLDRLGDAAAAGRVPRGVPFQGINIHSHQAHRTAAAGGDDLVSLDFQ